MKVSAEQEWNVQLGGGFCFESSAAGTACTARWIPTPAALNRVMP